EGKNVILTWDEPASDGSANQDLALNGYNIYHNGKLLNAEPHPEMEYIHTDGALAGGTYHVTAVYDQGESKACDPVSIESSGVEDITISGISVTVNDSTILIKGAKEMICVYSADGKVVANAKATGYDTFNVTSGIYIVKTDNNSLKVVVK
ncbi:MAG: T9SS type A sorting domain-containing protein, partial [Muribaculaceae bacterium]|nr:T9SS type A sorting domain-containing protein [Muribaculaceae bacterium]